MPRSTRIVLAALVSLVLIIGIYFSVQGASLGAVQDKVGSHYVSSSLINPNYYRAAAPSLSPVQVDKQFSGHDCSDEHVAPDD